MTLEESQEKVPFSNDLEWQTIEGIKNAVLREQTGKMCKKKLQGIFPCSFSFIVSGWSHLSLQFSYTFIIQHF